MSSDKAVVFVFVYARFSQFERNTFLFLYLCRKMNSKMHIKSTAIPLLHQLLFQHFNRIGKIIVIIHFINYFFITVNDRGVIPVAEDLTDVFQ